jgi:hypothetical protein
MPAFDTITVALAARFGPGTTTPPTGYDPITISTGYLPDQLLPTPCVLVTIDQGTFNHSAGKRDGVGRWIVRFYFNQIGDLERDMAALLAWGTVLVDQLKLAAQLAGIVTQAKVMTWKFGTLPYAGINYSGIELGVDINTNDAWSPVS